MEYINNTYTNSMIFDTFEMSFLLEKDTDLTDLLLNIVYNQVVVYRLVKNYYGTTKDGETNYDGRYFISLQGKKDNLEAWYNENIHLINFKNEYMTDTKMSFKQRFKFAMNITKIIEENRKLD